MGCNERLLQREAERRPIGPAAIFFTIFFHKVDVADAEGLKNIPVDDVTHVVHLAAQAGVRYSLVNPYIYGHSNMMGQLCVGMG